MRDCRAVVCATVFAGLLLLSSTAVAQPVTVCVPSGNAAERAELVSTLTGLGFTVENVDDPSTGTCTVAVSFSGGMGSAGIAWVDAGNGFVQMSDWGPGFIPNTWASVPPDSTHTIDVVDGSHPITAGMPPSWIGYGFWTYAGGDYLGWATSGPNLMRAGGYDAALSTATSGSGRLVYIGWTVYGSQASADDVEILRRSILWANGQALTAVNIPTNSRLGLALLAALIACAGVFALRRLI
jgi:hypothetical protein